MKSQTNCYKSNKVLVIALTFTKIREKQSMKIQNPRQTIRAQFLEIAFELIVKKYIIELLNSNPLYISRV